MSFQCDQIKVSLSLAVQGKYLCFQQNFSKSATLSTVYMSFRSVDLSRQKPVLSRNLCQNSATDGISVTNVTTCGKYSVNDSILA